MGGQENESAARSSYVEHRGRGNRQLLGRGRSRARAMVSSAPSAGGRTKTSASSGFPSACEKIEASCLRAVSCASTVFIPQILWRVSSTLLRFDRYSQRGHWIARKWDLCHSVVTDLSEIELHKKKDAQSGVLFHWMVQCSGPTKPSANVDAAGYGLDHRPKLEHA